MSLSDVNKVGEFIKALDTLKQDYVCGVCQELCKDPVTLSACFHIICGEHFKDLKTCPTCNISLAGCKTFKDDRLPACINSAKELDRMFEGFRNKLNVLNTSKTESNSAKKRAKTSKQVKKTLSPQESLNDEENKNVSRSKKLKRPDTKIDNFNSTMTSNVSVVVNKTVEKRNDKGETALHIACRLGKIDRVTELLNQGANTNTKDNAGWTPLHEVVQNGHVDLVKLLLQFNTLVNVPGLNNESPLHEAVRYKHKDIIEELVKNGADINARNCKGETPAELASDELKEVLKNAADNIVQTQGFNITAISELHTELDFDDIRVYCASSFRTVHSKLKVLCKHHTNLQIEAKFTKRVTILIVDTEEDKICMSSLDVLQGIVFGNWIISCQWVIKSTQEKLEPFKDFEVLGVGSESCNGPKKARYNKYKQLPGIFNGCHFYLHNFNTKYEISKSVVLTKAILSKLITDAGGIVLRRVPNPELIPDAEKLVPYHAKEGSKLAICSHYIIFKDMYEPMYNMQHFKALPIGWLIECIEKFELCNP